MLRSVLGVSDSLKSDLSLWSVRFPKQVLGLRTSFLRESNTRQSTMKLLLASLLAGSAAAFAPSTSNGASSTSLAESKADLESLAGKLNPVVKYFDPLGLAEQSFWNTSPEATIGFLRESEIKVGECRCVVFVVR